LNRYSETVSISATRRKGRPAGRPRTPRAASPGRGAGTGSAGILGGVSRRLVVWGLAGLAGAVAAFLLLDPILAAFLAVVGLCLWGVAVLSSDWERHSTFEQRELARARRRAEHRERTKGARERDRARWEAHQQRKAARSPDR